MTLRGKILLKMAALVGCFALLGSFSVWGFVSLRDANGAAEREFRELQEVRAISVRLGAARAPLEQGPAGRGDLSADLAAAAADLHAFVEGQADEADDEDSPAGRAHDASERKHADQATWCIGQIQASLAAASTETSHERELANLLDQASREVDGVADATASYLSLVHIATHSTVHMVLIAMLGASAAALAVAAGVGFSLYRSIVHPLRELSSGVREIAAGHFAKRLPEEGDPEFLAVIHEFNQMAAQLEEFYLRLEQNVAQKSRELVRSERLASVGFLAAGVAHEIRNPLGIISGYAELSLKMLGAAGSNLSSSAKEARILRVIRDEAFRCKQITDKLLGLVQGGGDGREAVDMAQIVRDVTFLVRGLETFRERHAELNTRVPDTLCAMVNPIELKQVVLNLTLNALDAVDVGSGKIEVEGRRLGERIELCVRDNGCGMSPDVIEHVFEPFFTSKRGRSAPGTGLGLSISHAIVSQYGGRLRAESEGPGRGSLFTLELPAAAEVKT